MNTIDIAFKDMDQSAALDEDIRHRIEQLTAYAPNLESVRVVVAAPHHHQRHGARYQVSIDAVMPGAAIVVGRHEREGAHEDPYLAVRDAFHVMRRRLQDAVRMQRHDVKRHTAERLVVRGER